MQEKVQAFRKYIGDVERELAAGNATEPTYYPYLKTLLEALETGITATNNPKRIECGAPDFVVAKGEVTLGYVEAKDVGKSLDAIEADARRAKPGTHDGDQLRRFLPLGNLVLTDYLEFRWYVDGERRATARLGTVGLDGKVKRDKKGMDAVGQLLADFLARPGVEVGTPKELAVRMARLAHMIRDSIVAAFEKEPEGGALHGQYMAFREHLIPDLKAEQFADMYGQTIAYGLFAARAAGNGGQKFSRQNAAYLLPRTNPFLRRLFNHIAGPELDERIAWALDELAQVLGRADMAAVLKDFGKHTKQEDPVVHFYETFLRAYDPKEKKLRGVYYTPEPVVSYIVRSVDYLLRTRFGRPLGLADPSVLVLDPAVGTGTFLYDVVKLIRDRMETLGQLGGWSDYVARHLLPRLFGFELLMAPYAVAHLKLGLLLQELGYEFQGEQRLGVYLTNTLEEAIKKSEMLFGQFIVEEANAAAEIKREKPIMVVLGNPPYSSSSANRGEWIMGLLEDYKTTIREEETQIQAVSDDYIKFLRFAQWRIERTGGGIVAFITNNNYLDGLNFRDVRKALADTFDEIFILNLHGNTRRRERAPDGSKDENVFDILVGVAIVILVRSAVRTGEARVLYQDIWGAREAKYSALMEQDVSTTSWRGLGSSEPAYMFFPVDSSLEAEYQQLMPIGRAFGSGDPNRDKTKFYGTGFKTQQDEFAIAFEPDEFSTRIAELLAPDAEEEELRGKYRLCATNQWSFEKARKTLSKLAWSDALIKCLYRPFDYRYTIFVRQVVTNPRFKIMNHLLRPNISLCVGRAGQAVGGAGWNLVFCSAVVEDQNLFYRGGNMNFPLYLYTIQDGLQVGAFRQEGRRPNLSADFVNAVEGRLGLRFVEDGRGDLEETFGPEDVFYYAYAVFHSPTYRARYAEFLKTDFPRLPLTSDKKLFAALAAKGAELVGLHLMESKALDALVTKWPVAGSDTVEKVRYDEKERRVWINGTQYFEGVPPEVWEFHIGGYQVCEKWLKDRKGRKLTWDDVQHYQRVVVALAETLRLMGEIDGIIPGWPLE